VFIIRSIAAQKHDHIWGRQGNLSLNSTEWKHERNVRVYDDAGKLMCRINDDEFNDVRAQCKTCPYKYCTVLDQHRRSPSKTAAVVTATSCMGLCSTGKLSDEEGWRKELATVLANLTVIDPNVWPSHIDGDCGELEPANNCVNILIYHSAAYEMRMLRLQA